MIDQAKLRARLKDIGLCLPITFNFNDKVRLSEAEDEVELKKVYQEIAQSISRVSEINRSINHSNHRNIT